MPASDPCVPCLGIVSRTFLEHLVLFLINALHSVFTFICSLSLLKASLCVFSLSKDSLHHFSFEHSFIFLPFYLFLPILPLINSYFSHQAMFRDATTSFHFCRAARVFTFLYMYVCMDTYVHIRLWLQCPVTRPSDQAARHLTAF